MGRHGGAPSGVGDNSPASRRPQAHMNPTSLITHPALVCALLLACSNLFMTIAWYGHLRTLNDRPWWVAALVSWGIALFEYLLQVPANRIGFTALSLAQLKILQEVITLAVFVPFAMLFMNAPLKLDYLWAGICMMGAVYFIFRS
jgi:uncharacterized protein (DUF486 family)